MATCIKCKVNQAVKETKPRSGFVEPSEILEKLYCQICLQEEIATGKYQPMYVPIKLPDYPRTGTNP